MINRVVVKWDYCESEPKWWNFIAKWQRKRAKSRLRKIANANGKTVEFV